MDDGSRRLNPSIIARKAGMRPDGSDDIIRRDGLFSASLDDALDDDAEIFAAPRKEADGFEVPAKGAVVDFVTPGDVRRREPIPVILLDVFPVGVSADGAFSGVALDMGLKLFVFNERLFGSGEWARRR